MPAESSTSAPRRACGIERLGCPPEDPHQYRPHQSFPSRFSPGPNANPPFEILYLSESPQVAQFEIGRLAGDPLVVGGILSRRLFRRRPREGGPSAGRRPHGCVPARPDRDDRARADWRLARLPDRAAARSSIQEPVGTAPTQDLGEAVFGVPGIEGFRVLSAKLAYHRNLIVFPEKMFKGSRLEFRDASAHLLQVIDGTVPKTARRGWNP